MDLDRTSERSIPAGIPVIPVRLYDLIAGIAAYKPGPVSPDRVFNIRIAEVQCQIGKGIRDLAVDVELPERCPAVSKPVLIVACHLSAGDREAVDPPLVPPELHPVSGFAHHQDPGVPAGRDHVIIVDAGTRHHGAVLARVLVVHRQDVGLELAVPEIVLLPVGSHDPAFLHLWEGIAVRKELHVPVIRALRVENMVRPGRERKQERKQHNQ